ncbi:MAG: aspartate kinase [Acidobacteria bacterium]|nr:MAG: aspartate kinase [Acidobacteriota bacterium]
MKVLKFGGTSVGDAGRIGRVADLVAARAGEGLLVVVSAMGGVTDLLLSLGSSARAKDRTAAEAALAKVGQRHVAAVEGLDLSEEAAEECRAALGRELARLGDLSTGVSLLGELSARTSDSVAAAGELLSAGLLGAALARRGADVVTLDPRDLVPTDGTHGAAVPDEEEIARRVGESVLPRIRASQVVLTGGFLGRGPDGATTTLGRGGSDYSAALLGAGLADAGAEVEAIEIWTDVDGILTADPRLVPGARLVREVSAAEAAELAFFGAKVLHPATIRPAVARGIPVVVRNTFRPEAPGTVVKAEAPGEGVRALAMRTGVAALFVSSARMLLAHGFAARVFSVFERHRVPVDVITTSEVSISITVDERAPVDALVAELSAIADVRTLRGLAVVSVVGRSLRTTPRVAAKIFGALGGINVVMISQGASETNLTFVVEGADAPEAVRRLHRELFEGKEEAG